MTDEDASDGLSELPQPVTTGWSLLKVVPEGGQVLVRGLDPWQREWVRDGTRIRITHPSYPDQRHPLDVYRIYEGGRTVTFAAGELSASVWAFYLPDEAFVPDEL